MAYKPQKLNVIEGGTGDVSLTAYSVLAGGTSTTGAIQNISGVGTTGQALTSNGAGALPTWQALTTSGLGYCMTMMNIADAGPAKSSTYFVSGSSFTTYTATGNASTRFTAPKAGTVKAVFGSAGISPTLASNQNTTIHLWKNGSSVETITSTYKMNASPATFSNTALTTTVVAGDYLEVVLSTPAWTKTPTAVRLTCTVYIE